MCNRYVTPSAAEIERTWQVGRASANQWWDEVAVPKARGVFLRRAIGAGSHRELVTGRWGLIPPFAKSYDIRFSTNNARSEELAAKPTFRDAWAKGQRCIIPATSFDEPCWETGKNQWWRFTRADGQPWGLAGLWNTWTDRSSGEMHESYTMLTINADHHPLIRRMNKPDPKLPPDAQDKRLVIVIEQAEVEQWLHGSLPDAQALIKLSPVEIFKAGPAATGLHQGSLL